MASFKQRGISPVQAYRTSPAFNSFQDFKEWYYRLELDMRSFGAVYNTIRKRYNYDEERCNLIEQFGRTATVDELVELHFGLQLVDSNDLTPIQKWCLEGSGDRICLLPFLTQEANYIEEEDNGWRNFYRTLWKAINSRYDRYQVLAALEQTGCFRNFEDMDATDYFDMCLRMWED